MRTKQFAALPYRFREKGIDVLLVTTRRNRRWSVPKGSPIAKMSSHQVAAIEAYEEAGLVGKISSKQMAATGTANKRA